MKNALKEIDLTERRTRPKNPGNVPFKNLITTDTFCFFELIQVNRFLKCVKHAGVEMSYDTGCFQYVSSK